ncbi:MAG: host attachment protein [Gammaproteobacteria bacterium]|nr:host attachment protein [Gammaproteobacteria bacterium]
MLWVISTDSNTCRIYSYKKSPAELIMLKEILHPENKLRKQDLVSDKPGHFKTKGPSHGAFIPSSDPKEVKIDTFSRQIAEELDKGRVNQSYKQFILIAPPHVNGLLNQHFNKHVKSLLYKAIQKDVLHLSQQELLTFLSEHAKFQDDP